MIEELHPSAAIRDDLVVRISGGGQVLARRSILELFRSTPEEISLRVPSRVKEKGGAPPHLDLIHANTVASIQWPHLAPRHPIYAIGNIILTSRRQHLVAIVEWESNRLLWSWGQGELLGPHEGQVLANGNILIFDNRTEEQGSRVIELDPIRREIVWEYRGESPEDFFAPGRGGAQRLANGNTLITETEKGRAFEVTSEGEIVWEFLTPHLTPDNHRFTFRRMRHYPRDAVDRMISAEEPHSSVLERHVPRRSPGSRDDGDVSSVARETRE